MSETASSTAAETAGQKVERLKMQIAQKLKERRMASGPGSESVQRAEAVLAQVRTRLMSGQADAGRMAVRQWMDSDAKNNG